jgi:hypothetical protein
LLLVVMIHNKQGLGEEQLLSAGRKTGATLRINCGQASSSH